MAVYYVGLVAPVDYPALYALCDGRLPDTFEAWRIVEDQARRDMVAAGHHVIGLHVGVLDLRDYCRAANIRTDARALHALATRIGNERFATQAEYRALREETVIVEDVRTGTVADEEAAGGPVLVQPPRPHWWQFWRRPVYARAPFVGDVPARTVVDATGEAVVFQRPRRHWWQFWRRPVYAQAPVIGGVRAGAVVGDAGAPMVVQRPRQYWWQFWRRPVYARVA
jgi:hypothetical protein